MSKRIGMIVLGLVVVGAGYYALNTSRGGKTISTASAASIWVEVTSPAVSLVGAFGKHKVLNTGDEVNPGDTLESSATGRAVIHMPDGSTLRIEENSKLTLDKAVFNPKDESVIVEATLQAGRVWSKVVSLVTPESEWQVKTSNAVATVRGTSFGVEYKGKKSKVLVSEHKVKVSVIDPQTKKFVAAAEREVDQGKFIEIKNEDIPAMALRKIAVPETLAIKDSFEMRDWSSKNDAADKEINDKIRAIKKEGMSDKQVRTIMRKETANLRETMKALRMKKESNEELNKEIKKSDAEGFKVRLKTHILEIKQAEEPKDGPKEKTAQDSNPGEEIRVIGKPVKLVLFGIVGLKTITGGKKISVKAFIVDEAGIRKEVTKMVSWNITGEIGSVKEGEFIANIPSQFSELPEIKGTIHAVYKDGDILLNSDTVDITVEPAEAYTTPIG